MIMRITQPRLASGLSIALGGRQTALLRASPILTVAGRCTYSTEKTPEHESLSTLKSTAKPGKMATWRKNLADGMVSVFNLDMDRVRAGPVGGATYYRLCADQGLQFKDSPLSDTAKFYYETLGLPKTFNQWFQIVALHEWMLFVRLRAMPAKYGKLYQQKLVDRTFLDMELRLKNEMNINSTSIIDKYLKDFNLQLRGCVVAYDEGFYSDDATLAAALWRNLFNGDKNIDIVHLETMVRYVRTQLYVFDNMSDREIGMGAATFVKPWAEHSPLTKEEIEKRKQEIIASRKPDSELQPHEKSSFSDI
ncbi:hypothetical protein NADFUDRAFT_81785 [Nadsonia fulvescens var. elongata DSM 6958]|uniref:Ubiquinol-cytochrome c chaperone domain-containing protein n=1 Tax=Nadsonia fulvescens var. elongata DSM 6958 TaxID=857566 RepID=A0A1E3PP74_9ASCO|nr:hypothetical protein NADFUDRAFT_81785 [Nadsonia fulvescens var. elongata DSM 6958]